MHIKVPFPFLLIISSLQKLTRRNETSISGPKNVLTCMILFYDGKIKKAPTEVDTNIKSSNSIALVRISDKYSMLLQK